MTNRRSPSPLRRVFNATERLFGGPLEALGQSPDVNGLLILIIRSQAQARRNAELLHSLIANSWGMASRRDLNRVLRQLADIERAVLDLEHMVEAQQASANAKRAPARRPRAAGKDRSAGTLAD